MTCASGSSSSRRQVRSRRTASDVRAAAKNRPQPRSRPVDSAAANATPVRENTPVTRLGFVDMTASGVPLGIQSP